MAKVKLTAKVFQNGGPYADLFSASARDAKLDPRLKNSGELVCFVFGGLQFPLTPPTAFYDWLFLRAFVRNADLLERIVGYAGFTDIEFNPSKSLNCQARACATAVTLSVAGELVACAKSFSRFASKSSGFRAPSRRLQPEQQSLAV